MTLNKVRHTFLYTNVTVCCIFFPKLTKISQNGRWNMMNEAYKIVPTDGMQPFDSDLAMERKRASTYVEGVDYKRETSIGGVWERLKVTSDAGARSIGRPIGYYDTLTVPIMDTIVPEDIEDAKEELSRELCRMCDLCDIIPSRVLVVGLGNPELTPDAIGAAAANEVEATMHIKKNDPDLFESFGCSEICVVCPNVASSTGIPSAEIVRCIAKEVQPSMVIAIDSLASRSEERLGNTIQVSNTGIFPGSGVGNNAGRIDESCLGIPVIAIGVPTVMGISTGHGATARQREMFVSPKGINRIVKNAAKIVGGSINQAFGICYF